MADDQARPGQPHHPADPADPAAHRTSTAERGPFAYARCSCGWNGPARRARDRARRDAAGHPGTV